MKKITFILALALPFITWAQSDIQEILKAGIEDAERYSKSYVAPVAEGFIYNLSNGWYDSAETKDILSFDISILGNYSMVKDDKKSFRLNPEDYNYLRFEEGVSNRRVATVFGENNPEVIAYIDYETSNGTETTSIVLPQGIGDSDINFVPSAYLQGSIGVFKATEVKLRFTPKIKIDDAETQLYGIGVQHEISKWFEKLKLPIAVSGIIAYSNVQGTYYLENSSDYLGENQRIETDISSWLFSSVVSTKLKVINFYGGLGYVTGKADTKLKGTYEVDEGELRGQSLVDPYAITNSANGVSATLGTKLTLGFFKLNVAYSFQEYNNITAGIHFGI